MNNYNIEYENTSSIVETLAHNVYNHYSGEINQLDTYQDHFSIHGEYAKLFIFLQVHNDKITLEVDEYSNIGKYKNYQPETFYNIKDAEDYILEIL